MPRITWTLIAWTLTSLLLLVSAPALAQSTGSGSCPGVQIFGDAEVPVHITPRTISTATTGTKVLDYEVSLGTDNRLACLCLHGGGTVVLTLPRHGRYTFLDIRFEYPFGFEPADNPFPLSVVHRNSLVFHMQSRPDSNGLIFKYVVTVKDRLTGATLIIDPIVTNRPKPPQ